MNILAAQHPGGWIRLERDEHGWPIRDEDGKYVMDRKGGAVALISHMDVVELEAAFVKNRLMIMGQSFRIVNPDYRNDFALIVTDDNWRAPFIIFSDRVVRTWHMLNICAVRILHIWGLADHGEGETYKWADVYALAWIQRQLLRPKDANA